jgi:CTP:molybdopterin cytidylyltransferase MocA
MSAAAPRVIGILLAAGRGRRLGGTKQLLPWPPPDGDRPLIAAAFDAVAPACDAMVVVTGHEAARVEAALAPRQFRIVRCDADAEMIESVRAGLRAARSIDAGATVLLQPADHPEVAAETLTRLGKEAGATPGVAVMPEHNGRGGHPVMVPASLVPEILAWTGTGGLRAFWREHADRCRRVAVNDAAVVRDLDTPEQYG